MEGELGKNGIVVGKAAVGVWCAGMEGGRCLGNVYASTSVLLISSSEEHLWAGLVLQGAA